MCPIEAHHKPHTSSSCVCITESCVCITESKLFPFHVPHEPKACVALCTMQLLGASCLCKRCVPSSLQPLPVPMPLAGWQGRGVGSAKILKCNFWHGSHGRTATWKACKALFMSMLCGTQKVFGGLYTKVAILRPFKWCFGTLQRSCAHSATVGQTLALHALLS